MHNQIESKIGIIAGKGALPTHLLSKATEKGYKVFVLGIAGFAKAQDFADCNYFESGIGEVGKILDFFKKNDVTKLILAGKIDKPKWSTLSADFIGGDLLAQILKNKFLGDNSIMNIINNFFNEKGFEIISGFAILDALNIEGAVSNIAPSKQDMLDLKTAFHAAKLIGAFDIGQSVVIENGCILGVEGLEGTDNLIKRCAQLRRFNTPSGILVKLAKPNQIDSLDPPVIGCQTVRILAQEGFKGVGIEKERVMIIDFEKVIDLANELGIFIFIISDGWMVESL